MQSILQHILKKNNLTDVTVDVLQKITKEFPYFSVAQFLLTCKLQQLSDPGYEDQFQKTCLYFHNPLWLQQMLREPGATTELVGHTATIEHLKDDGLTGDIASGNSFDEIGRLSHDLTEEVLLNQETDFTNPELNVALKEIPLEAHSVEIINGHKEKEIPTVQQGEPFSFQAFYTVDYFASQGIKLNSDSKEEDKLGKQLKSFTEWLKIMRRLPETSVVEILDKIKESEIAKIAAHSLEEKEIVTESMAEVLVKQGKIEKAGEVYQKLSLQNPHKSTYFTAKINDLKQN